MNMQTVHLTNFKFDRRSKSVQIILLVYIVISLIIVMTASSIYHALLYAALLFGFVRFSYWLILKSQISYTLTPTHFQQHLYHGGWVVKWNNILEIGQCTHNQAGWHSPLPWIGIRLKSYAPYLDSICPRIISEILLSQRGLLYLGMKQDNNQFSNFEDIVLDATHYKTEEGQTYTGLLAMLANRMHYQRAYYGYDVFISMSDLGKHSEHLVGLTRRYLAAAEPEISKPNKSAFHLQQKD